LRGAVTLQEALDRSATPGADDSALAKVLCDNDMPLRQQLSFALLQLVPRDIQ
jgi:hypothetical protein